jgi:nicotinate-nucleotide pyrophosphorylase
MSIDVRTDHLIDLALEEDAGLGDVTSRAIFPVKHRSRAVIGPSKISSSAASRSPPRSSPGSIPQ